MREWRATAGAGGTVGAAAVARDGDESASAARLCPLCRAPSHVVTPSAIWPATKEAKAEILSQYRDRLSTIHCRTFDRGAGECPFGSSCFYRHELPDGTVVGREGVRTATGGAGTEVLGAVRLSDFLGVAGAR